MERGSNQITLIGIASIVALAILGVWIYLGYKSEGYRADTFVVAQDLADASIQSDKNMALKTSLKHSQNSVANLTSYFINEAGIPDFIGMIEKDARDHMVFVEISSINLGGNSGDVVPRPLSLHLNGSCLWKDCVGFISSIDSLHYAIDIKNVSLTNGKGSWKFSIDMIQYVLK